MKEKGSFLVVAGLSMLLFIVVVGVVYAGYYGYKNGYFNSIKPPNLSSLGLGAKPTPESVEQMPSSTPSVLKTYVDSESRFTFDYPATWTQSKNSVVSDYRPPNLESGRINYSIVVFYYDKGFAAWRDPKSTAQASIFSSGSLNNYFTHSTFATPGEEPSYEVFIDDGSKMVSFSLSPYEESKPDEDTMNIFNEILASFKFTK